MKKWVLPVVRRRNSRNVTWRRKQKIIAFWMEFDMAADEIAAKMGLTLEQVCKIIETSPMCGVEAPRGRSRLGSQKNAVTDKGDSARV